MNFELAEIWRAMLTVCYDINVTLNDLMVESRQELSKFPDKNGVTTEEHFRLAQRAIDNAMDLIDNVVSEEEQSYWDYDHGDIVVD